MQNTLFAVAVFFGLIALSGAVLGGGWLVIQYLQWLDGLTSPWDAVGVWLSIIAFVSLVAGIAGPMPEDWPN